MPENCTNPTYKYYYQDLKTTGKVLVIASQETYHYGNNNYEVDRALSNRLKSQHI